jgi:23S rRNA A1618 N6-methylase RlmF
MELSKTEARPIFEVLRSKDLFNYITSFIPKYMNKPDQQLIMIELGDTLWVKKQIQFGRMTINSRPKSTNKFMIKLLDEEWIYANELFQTNNINKLAQAIIDNKVIYSNMQLMNCAASYKQARFINWFVMERQQNCARVVILK